MRSLCAWISISMGVNRVCVLRVQFFLARKNTKDCTCTCVLECTFAFEFGGEINV